MSLGEKLITATEKAAEIKIACDNTSEAINIKLGTTDKINAQDFADKVDEVYDKGEYDERSKFWRTYLGATDFSVLFAYNRFTSGNFYPTQDIVCPSSSVGVFRAMNRGNSWSLKQRLEECGVVLDTSKAETLQAMFHQNKMITEAPTIDLSNTINNNSYLFYESKIITIEKLIYSSKTTYSSATFGSATQLVNVTFDGEITGLLDMSPCSKLTPESMKSAILHLKNYAGTANEYKKTIKLHATAWSNLDASTTPAEDGIEFDGSWKDYINHLGWNYA